MKPIRRVATLVTERTATVYNQLKAWKHTLKQFITLITALAATSPLIIGRVAAQSGVCPDGPDPPEAVAAVIRLLNQLQLYGLSIAFAAAAVSITYAGLLLFRGRPADIERAKQVIFFTVLGLVVVLVAGGFVDLVREPMCP